MAALRKSRSATPTAITLGLALACCVLATTAARGSTVIAKNATLEHQVRVADVIVRGTCEDKATTFSNKHFITTYKIAVKKYLKAPAKMTAQNNPSLLVSTVGGRIEKPLPLEESYPMMPVMFRGENVVLFLRAPGDVPEIARAKYNEYLSEGLMKPSPLITNYRLIALDLSKLTVVRNPKTGAELVTRINLDRFGLLPSTAATKRYVEAYESRAGTIDVQRGRRAIRIPVQISKPVPPGQLNMEQKVRRMLNYTATWSDFQSQVADILKNQDAPDNRATAQKETSSGTDRTTDSRENK